VESIRDRMVRAMSESSTNRTRTGADGTLDEPPQGIQEQSLVERGFGDVRIGPHLDPASLILL
jgi:hypothetical protein